MNPVRLFRMTLWKKFTALGLLCLLVIALPTGFYWHSTSKAISITAYELQGLPHLQFLFNIIQRTQQHRGISMRYMLDAGMPAKEQRKKAEELEAAIADYEDYLKKNHDNQGLAGLDEISKRWHELHPLVFQKRLSATESFEQHTQLIRFELDYLQHLVDEYQLSLDPDSESYFLIASALVYLPEQTEIMAQIRGYGVGLLAQGDMSMAERAQLQALLLLSKQWSAQLDMAIHKVVMVSQGKRDTIYENYRATQVQYEHVVQLAETELLDKSDFSITPESFYSAFTLGINGYFSYAHFSLSQMDNILREHIARKQQEMFVAMLYVLAAVLLLAVVYIRFVKQLLARLGGEPDYASEVLRAVTRGDLEFDIETPHPNSLIAEMKLMEQTLRENSRRKNEYIATLSHELRAPLTAISGALMVAVSGKLGDVPKPVNNLLDLAYNNTQHLAELINDLLDAGKLSSSRLVLDLRVQLLMPIVDDACRAMNAYVHKYGVKLITGLRYDTVVVRVDARRLRQVLMNLISNAAKFSNKGDEVALNISVAHDRVRIEVVDHGCGIAAELQPHLLQKIIPSEGEPQPHGGLGLAIAKDLIEAMGGIIGFTSTPGLGSSFFVELPLEELNSD